MSLSPVLLNPKSQITISATTPTTIAADKWDPTKPACMRPVAGRGTWAMPANSAGGAKLCFGNVTGLTGTLSISWDGTTFYDWACIDSNGTPWAAGETITTSDYLELNFEAAGAAFVRFTQVGGTSGPARLVATFGAWGVLIAFLKAMVLGGAGSTFYNTILSTADGTVAGNAATKIPTNDTAGRKGVVIANHSGTRDLWIKVVATGAGAPTISSTSKHWSIPVNSDRFFALGDGVDIYAQNSVNDAATTDYTIMEVE